MTSWKRSPKVDLTRHQAREAGVGEDDAARQQRTAEEILRRLRTKPGQILADEVGMGKTFTALAVAASVALENKDDGPVVIMVPPSLSEKWPEDWEEFADRYLEGDDPLRTGRADTAIDFLRLLDDPPEERARIIFMKSGAFGLDRTDPWVRLAIAREALRGQDPSEHEWRALRKWGWRVVGEDDREKRFPGTAQELLGTPPSRWRKVVRNTDLDPGDDPIPESLIATLRSLNLDPVRNALRDLPQRQSKNSEERLARAAKALKEATSGAWFEWRERADFELPLLILDEAHHVKNRWTKLASLFENDSEGDGSASGALAGRFDRLLFLTATPFQLGHGELIQILSRFEGANWASVPMSRATFEGQLKDLEGYLDEAQTAMTRLQDDWSRLEPTDVPMKPREWWNPDVEVDEAELPQTVLSARAAMGRAIDSMGEAETALAPWLIRHTRDGLGTSPERREEIPRPLDVGSGILLPFLLAARAEYAFRAARRAGRETGRAGALFSEGIYSSFEAYLSTREEDSGAEAAGPESDITDQETRWYLRSIERALPGEDPELLATHPKISSTVDQVVDLWQQGHKVVVFCYFLKTGDALRRHISDAIDRSLVETAAGSFDLKPAGVDRALRNLADQFLESSDRPAGRAMKEALVAIVDEATNEWPDDERARLIESMLRYIRSGVVLSRFGSPVFHQGAAGVPAMLDTAKEGGSLRNRLTEFVEYIDLMNGARRERVLDALLTIEIGRIRVNPGGDPERAGGSSAGTFNPTVRLANGQVDHDTRQRLIPAFNSPLLPEVLISSKVLGEGVDLHHDCRHVIHHDLDWNPTVIEQQTGRIDRLRSKAERTGQPVELVLPYIKETQNEKLYRVMKDRERWFQVVMGADAKLDEEGLDEISTKVPLPENAARALAFRLECPFNRGT